jgi:hypothetical protein
MGQLRACHVRLFLELKVEAPQARHHLGQGLLGKNKRHRLVGLDAWISAGPLEVAILVSRHHLRWTPYLVHFYPKAVEAAAAGWKKLSRARVGQVEALQS